MNETDLSKWQHAHSFGQDVKRDGEFRTKLVIGLTLSMMAVEIAAGIAFGSMALLADGIHMASHAVALAINVFAYVYARKHAHDSRFSFGTGKVNALGGYTGAILLAAFALMMAWESVHRLIWPTSIAFNWAIAVAVIGLVVNGVSVVILGDNHHHDHGHNHAHGDHDHAHEDHEHHHHHDEHDHHEHHDHNLRSAYLHVLADALTSLTAIVALLTAKYAGWLWMDPLMGIVGSLLVAKWSLGLLRQSGSVLLDRQASAAKLKAIHQAIEANPDVKIADLHVWSIGPEIYSVAMTVVAEAPICPDALKAKLNPKAFVHVTIEVQCVP